jgi:hypothetical protein
VPHELKESEGAVDLSVTAPTREDLFRAALAGVLEAAYGAASADGSYEGQVVPVQAAADDDGVLLAGLVDDTLRAVREENGTLRPPRWLAFDEKRVTAALPLHLPKTPGRLLTVSAAEVAGGDAGWTARLELLVPVAS